MTISGLDHCSPLGERAFSGKAHFQVCQFPSGQAEGHMFGVLGLCRITWQTIFPGARLLGHELRGRPKHQVVSESVIEALRWKSSSYSTADCLESMLDPN